MDAIRTYARPGQIRRSTPYPNNFVAVSPVLYMEAVILIELNGSISIMADWFRSRHGR